MVNDRDATFGIFLFDFGDERKGACAGDVGFYLWGDIFKGKGRYMPFVVVAVGDDVNHGVEKDIARVATV